MIIETVDKRDIPATISREVGLCYFDPNTEELKEFSSSTSIYLTPFEHSVKRYYFVKNSDLVDNVIPSYVKFTALSGNPDIDVKINVGRDRITSKYDYYDTEINNTVTAFFNEFPSNIIAVDVYFKSNTNRELATQLTLNIIVE